MIKLQRISAPVELTPKVVVDKTALFKSNPDKSVWKEPYIQERLLEMTHNKCAYCECRLNVESNYMEIEHFHDKHQYPDEVVIWDNLLPSCKKCNDSKGTHDTLNIPIVNPSVDDPKEFLGYKVNAYCYKSKNAKGQETIDALNLNDIEKHCTSRYKICIELLSKVAECLDTVRRFTDTTRTQDRNRLRNKVIEILEVCQSDKDYTALKATVIANDCDYSDLVSELKSENIWTQELEDLDAKMRGYCLDAL